MKPCPDEEGIKTRAAFSWINESSTLKPCPDEEGIKTPRQLLYSVDHVALKPCPDEEGIKTLLPCPYRTGSRFFETLP